jgi:hypothetical protein
MPRYRKALAGFDFRSPTIPALQPLKIRNPSELERTPKAATLDPELWRAPEGTAYDAERNGVNLIDQSSEDLYDGIAPSKAALAAFDIPYTLLTDLATTFGFRDLDHNRLTHGRWRFLGFDVVDIRTQSSALYSFDLSEGEQDKLRKAVPFPLNDWGLLNREADAISMCSEFDVVIPGHAPFAPCGVWMPQKPGTDHG